MQPRGGMRLPSFKGRHKPHFVETPMTIVAILKLGDDTPTSSRLRQRRAWMTGSLKRPIAARGHVVS